jgi:Tfp pilus assembly protein PilW
MKYTAYALMFAMVLGLSSFVFAADDLNALMAQLQASGDVTTPAPTGNIVTAPADQTHAVAEVKIQNTTYTHNGSEYTLTWTPVQGTSKVEVSVKNADTDMDYTKVSTVVGSAGTVKVNLTSQGTYMIKFTPVDDLSTPL